MRLHPRSFAIVAIAATLGCGQTTAPTIAALGSSTSSGAAALSISPKQLQLVVGGTAQLSTNAPFSLQSQVQWSSLQSTIVTISPSGAVNAVAVGSATITARYSSDTTNVATATIVVVAPGTP